jgi:hypothetical protein
MSLTPIYDTLVEEQEQTETPDTADPTTGDEDPQIKNREGQENA